MSVGLDMQANDDNGRIPVWPFVRAYVLDALEKTRAYALEAFKNSWAYTREKLQLGAQTLWENRWNIWHITKGLSKSVAISAGMGLAGMFMMEYEFLFTKLILKYVHRGADPVAIVKSLGALFVALSPVGYSIAHYRVGVTLKDIGQVAQLFVFFMASHLTYYSGYKAGLLMKQVGLNAMWATGFAYLATELVGHAYDAYLHLRPKTPPEKTKNDEVEAQKAAFEAARLARENELKEKLSKTLEEGSLEEGHKLGVATEGDRRFDLAAWNQAQEELKTKAAADAEAKRIQEQGELEERRRILASAAEARNPQQKP